MARDLLAPGNGGAVLNNFVTFGTLNGDTLNIKKLFADEVHYGEIFSGEDTAPDVYQFGQVAGNQVGLLAMYSTTPILATPLVGQSGRYYVGNEAVNNGLTQLVEPVYYNSNSVSVPDPLNPYMTVNTSLTATSGTNPNSQATHIYLQAQAQGEYIIPRVSTITANSVPVCSAFWSAVGCPVYTGVDGDTKNTFDRRDLFSTLGTGGAFGVYGNVGTPGNDGGRKQCYFVAGSSPVSAVAPWGAVTSVAATTVGATKSIVVNYSGGIVGSTVQFPPTGSTALMNNSALMAVSPVYPVNGTTNAVSPLVQTYFGGINASGYVAANLPNSNGIWVQRLYWIPTNSATFQDCCYDVTHCFTAAGNGGSPRNAATLTLSARAAPSSGQNSLDGAFSLTLVLPTTFYTTTNLVPSTNIYVVRNRSSAPALPAIVNTLGAGSWGIVFATTNGTAQPTSCRSTSTLPAQNSGPGNIVPPAGGAGAPIQSSGNTLFTISPSNSAGTTAFPNTQTTAYNLNTTTFPPYLLRDFPASAMSFGSILVAA